MWIDKVKVVGKEKFPKVARLVENMGLGVIGDWRMGVTVKKGKEKIFHMTVANYQTSEEVNWKEEGLVIMGAMRYGKEGAGKDAIFEIRVVYQTRDTEQEPYHDDLVSELELLAAVARQLVKEEAFPHARMAINAKSLLTVKGVRKYLSSINLPAIVWSNHSED